MNLESQQINIAAGRVLVAGFEGLALPSHLKDMISKGALGGVVFFKRNVESAQQVAEVIAEARSLSVPGREPIFCVDQEGGRVVRLRTPLTALCTARKLGNINDTELTKDAGALVGKELRALGFTLNFAPVLDVDTNPDSPVIGDRSYSGSPEGVIEHGLAFAKGLNTGGVLACAKHFPGHGDAAADSHLSLPLVSHDTDRLTSTEMKPFESWVNAKAGPVMTAHVIYPALDSTSPATFSHKIVTGQLRNRLGFDGLVFSDDLEMGAVSEFGGATGAAQKSIRAGVDGLLVCRSEELQQSICENLTLKAEKKDGFRERLMSAANQIDSLSKPPGANVEFDWIGSTEHEREKSDIARRLEKEVS